MLAGAIWRGWIVTIFADHSASKSRLLISKHTPNAWRSAVKLLIDPEGMPIFEPANELTHEEIDTGHMSGVMAMRICHPSVMMRKAAVVQAGGYWEHHFAEDLDLFLRLAEIGRLAESIRNPFRIPSASPLAHPIPTPPSTASSPN